MKILIVRLGSLGDIIHTIPAAQRLQSLHPHAEIHWLTEPHYRGLVESVPEIRRVWTADTKAWRKSLSQLLELARLGTRLRSQGFDRAIDFQGLLKSALLARLSGAALVQGYSLTATREPVASLFYTDAVRTAEGRRHQVDRHLDLVEPPRHHAQRPHPIRLNLRSEVIGTVSDFLRDHSLDRPILLNPGGGWSTKRWPPRSFGQLADQIEDRLPVRSVFTYGPGEEGLIKEALSASVRHSRPTFGGSIEELAALCRQSRLLVAGDTGPLHLAVALGTPVTAILGPAYSWRTGPYSPEDTVVLHDLPCPRPYSRKCSSHFCMDIPVERVFAAVVRRLGGSTATGKLSSV